jgi:hypothetical protein
MVVNLHNPVMVWWFACPFTPIVIKPIAAECKGKMI